VLERLPSGLYQDPHDPGEGGYPPAFGIKPRYSVTDEEAFLLLRLARGFRVLEIGTGLAVATRALAASAQSVTTVDPDPWVRDPELPAVTFRRSLPSSGTFDLAFIDGCHLERAVRRDLGSCQTLDIPILVLHDTYLEGVAAAIDAFHLVPLHVYPTRCQLGVYRWP